MGSAPSAPLRDARELLAAMVGHSPWTGWYETDWCHFCNTEPDYSLADESAWKHHDNCAWLAAKTYLARPEGADGA